MMRFFEVAAKCGHVGISRYYRGLFYIQAENGKAAAAIVRMKPRVKHDRKDAILAVTKIDYQAFKAGRAAHRLNPYFNCCNSQDQKFFLAEIANDIHAEEDFEEHSSRRDSGRLAKRKMDKYNNFNIGA